VSQPDALVTDLEDLVLRLSALTARREGLSRTAAATLSRLANSGPTRLTELAAAEEVSQPSMSGLAARLVDQGLVHRGSDPQDARVVLLALTPAGRDVVDQRREARTQRLADALSGLTEDDVTRIAAAVPALNRLADALRRSATEVTR
jgi:DNA-binding MarR family transcriptional regulator